MEKFSSAASGIFFGHQVSWNAPISINKKISPSGLVFFQFHRELTLLFFSGVSLAASDDKHRICYNNNPANQAAWSE